jgi:rhodanese-related sulfurtransferase
LLTEIREEEIDMTRPRPALYFAALLLALPACRADLTGLQVLGVDALAARVASGDELTICDANNEDTRQRLGTIPGATLLTHYRDYDAASELPTDKASTLVFYCHSEMCSAAADAARKALTEGYRDVWVMAPGIRGWAAARQPVAAPAVGAAS